MKKISDYETARSNNRQGFKPQNQQNYSQASDMINERTNNQNDTTNTSGEPNVERANDAGMGDSGVNDERLTSYTSNRSADA